MVAVVVVREGVACASAVFLGGGCGGWFGGGGRGGWGETWEKESTEGVDGHGCCGGGGNVESGS